jgi:PAS domain S-box-containing protein
MCPTLYGFIPQTFCGAEVAALCAERTGLERVEGDGDPMDICVLSEKTFAHGSFFLSARPIGGLRMIDGRQADDKIIAVHIDDPDYRDYRDIDELPPHRLRELQRFLNSHETLREGEYRIRRADGVYRWVRLRNFCMRDAEGAPLRMTGSVSDIDDYKRVEAALRESEERYALALTGSDEGHWMWDLGPGTIFVSAKLAEIFGLPGGAQLLQAEHYFSSIPLHPDDRERVGRNREDHLAGLTPRLDHEFRIVRSDSGEVRWIHTRAQCFRDASGQPLRLAGSTTDITARKRSEEALRRSEERYQLAVAGSNEGMWDWDLASDMLFLSPRAQQLTFVESSEPLQPRRVWIDKTRYHPDDVEPVYRDVYRLHTFEYMSYEQIAQQLSCRDHFSRCNRILLS